MAVATQVVRRIISPIEDFLKTESSSGIVLMITAIVAMLWANSPFYESYQHFIEFPIGFTFGDVFFEKGLHEWVNDGLMVIFFFVVGLEIKRELMLGELSSPKKAALPIFAALGGMVAPALIYTFFNFGTSAHVGWGIPMATDIAFAVGVLSLLSNRVPFSLKIFLLALAIVDDLGAVLVIAFFYTDNISTAALGTAAFAFILTYMFRMAGVKNMLIYWALGIVAWICVLKSGVHATIAGVVLGLLTPVNAFIPKQSIGETLKELVTGIVDELKSDNESNHRLNLSTERKIHQLKKASTESISPLERLIHHLHPWVSFVIMPLFALVNAGVRIEGIHWSGFLHNHIALGVILGLFLGKPIGVLTACFLAVKFKLAHLPSGVTWLHMLAIGILAGIGFTMALFVSHLALGGHESETYSKLGILTGSVAAGILGSVFLLFFKPHRR